MMLCEKTDFWASVPCLIGDIYQFLAYYQKVRLWGEVGLYLDISFIPGITADTPALKH